MVSSLTRRDFLKHSVVAGISVAIVLPGSATLGAFLGDQQKPAPPWDPKQGRMRYRTDAAAKVCGDKVFSFDMRSADMPGWPSSQSHAMLLRATRADSVYAGFDLSFLDAALQPDKIVTAAELEADGIALPAFYGPDMLLPVGKTPAYLGHAVALLIWHDFARYRVAKRALKFRDDIVRWAEQSGPLDRNPWGTFRYVRTGGNTPFAPDQYSSLKDTPLFPTGYRKNSPQWPLSNKTGPLNEQGVAHAEDMRNSLDEPPAHMLVLKGKFSSQSIEMAALEPDNGNGWYDAATSTLHLVVATQSPQEVAYEGAQLLAATRLGVKQLILHPCYTVGYGTKDHSTFPYLAMMASIYGEGRPVRLACDRFEQFQAALKRHSFEMTYRISVDKKSGKFDVFEGVFEGNGGGRCNFSPSVCLVAATAAQSIYYFPRSDLSSTVVASRALDAGSARGYGTLQSMSATEMFVDEIAQALGMDPIELRMRNVFGSGMKNTQGAIPGGAMRADEVLTACRNHPLWTERATRKAQYEAAHPGKLYGVGFGCVQKDFGTGAEAAFASLSIDRDGHVAMRHIGVDIGTGMATSQAALCVQWLGKPADEIATGVVNWPELPLKSSGDPYTMPQADLDRLSQDPSWTPSLSSASAASDSAYYFGHASREAARLLFTQGLWPAARVIWSEGIGGGQLAPLSVRREEARWVEGKLTAGGLTPLAFEELVAKAYELGLATGVVVHTFNRWQWAEGSFGLPEGDDLLPLDGVALRWGIGSRGPGTSTAAGFKQIARKSVAYPPMQRNNAGVVYYSAIGTLAEVEVDTADGKVSLLNHHSVLECGNLIVPQLVSGQLQGGLAMGIGHALHEYLPLYEDGPGNGTWNFNRYRLPRARDVAVWQQTSEILPALSETDPPKGMAEVVMIAVVPAIANALAHATGKRFRDLPVTDEKVLAALAGGPGNAATAQQSRSSS